MMYLTPPTIHGDGLDDERALLGVIVSGSEVWDNRLSAELFFSEQHRRVFEACERLRNSGNPIDIYTVAREMACSETDLRQAGVVVTTLAESMGVVDHLPHYVTNVVADWRLRTARQRAIEFIERLNDPTVDIDEVEREFNVTGFAPPSRPLV